MSKERAEYLSKTATSGRPLWLQDEYDKCKMSKEECRKADEAAEIRRRELNKSA